MKTLFLICCGLLLSACSNKPPSCADSDATDIIDQMIVEKLEPSKGGFNQTKKMYPTRLANPDHDFSSTVKLKDIRTISKNPDTGGFKCEAKIVGDYTSTRRTNDYSENGLAFEFYQKEVSKDITYTTEILEDTGEVYVMVYGLGWFY